MPSYEIEIKSLIGSKEDADALINRLHKYDPHTALKDQSQQLNHYFEGGDINELYQNLHELFDEEKQYQFKRISEEGQNFSVRTREANGVVKFVVKASIGDDTSENGVSRIEFDEEVSLSLDELDGKILDSGYGYQAKWSRERQEYFCNNTNVCIDRNAGYGYLAEFERVVDEAHASAQVEQELREFMAELEVAELQQDRLERMFAHYNKNWPEYYGTDKVFVIE